MGGSDPQYFSGELNYVNLTEQSAWVFEMDSVYVEDVSVCSGGCQAFADTGHILLSGPEADISKINDKLGFDENGTIDCSKVELLPSKMKPFN